MEDATHKFQLPPTCSNYTAEAFSIMKAVKLIKKEKIKKKYAIYTDSLAVIQSLKQQTTKKAIIQTIIEDIHQVQANGKDIEIIWTPFHCGITGNEKAEEAAKTAIEEPLTPLPIPDYDYKALIKKEISKFWQDKWTQTTENKLHRTKPETTK